MPVTINTSQKWNTKAQKWNSKDTIEDQQTFQSDKKMEEYISLQRQQNMLSTEIGWNLFKQMVQKILLLLR